jgi:RNA polymerase sigma-70 factor, ECF subfamily
MSDRPAPGPFGAQRTIDIPTMLWTLAEAPYTTRAMSDRRLDGFERTVLPHLGAAYNLARWLTRNEADAQDVVQEACLRALRYFDGLSGADKAKAWLLSIVRHACFTWLAKNRPGELGPLDDEASESLVAGGKDDPETPERALLAADERALLDRLIEALPPEFREVVILRELEELSYREIAEITALPIGTVMSRLSRARERLRAQWARQQAPEERHGL